MSRALVRPLDNLTISCYNRFAMFFQKIETKRKSAYAAEQLISAIKNGVYKAGDKLPSERELAKQMGISRPLIREALSALHLAGIIESRPGDGTYIRKNVRNGRIEAQVLSILEGDVHPVEVLEARKSLEEGIAKLAAEKANTEDLKRIERALTQEEKAAKERDYDNYVKSDRDFHLAIAAASHNSLLEAAVRPLIKIMGQELWGGMDLLYLFNDQGIKQTLDEHRRIFDAIRQRNVTLAVEAVRRHLNRSKERFLGDSKEGQ